MEGAIESECDYLTQLRYGRDWIDEGANSVSI